MTTRTGRAYATRMDESTPECDQCGERPWVEVRPAIGVVLTCGCNRCMTVEMTGKFPEEWE